VSDDVVPMDVQNVVLDASAVVSYLFEDSVARARIKSLVDAAYLIAPVIMPFEVANVIRRRLSARMITPDAAENAWVGLAELDVEPWQWATLAPRIWELRGSITSYDASYVALAEIMQCPLITADAKLAAMAPPTCQIELV